MLALIAVTELNKSFTEIIPSFWNFLCSYWHEKWILKICLNKGNEKQFTLIWQAPVVKNVPARAGDVRDTGFIPGSGRSVDEGINPLQCSCLVNPMDRGVWQDMVHRVTKSQTWLKQLHMQAGQIIHSFIVLKKDRVKSCALCQNTFCRDLIWHSAECCNSLLYKWYCVYMKV